MIENEDNTDKLTQGRNSIEIQQSKARKFYLNFLGCLMPCFFKEKTPKPIVAKDNSSQMRPSNLQASIMSEPASEKPISKWAAKKQNLIKSVYQYAHRLLSDYDEQFLDKSTIKKWHSYPIYQYKENELFCLGTSKGRVLCRINCVKIQASALTKKKTNQSRTVERSDRFSGKNFDKYWSKRYILFQKFDEGISLDDEAWFSTTPEAIAEYVASKIKCETVLDGFCGAGGVSLKLANTCSRVISNDICSIKLKCLQNNAMVYGVDNIEMFNHDFLKVEGIQPDTIFLCPPFGSQQNLLMNSIKPNQMHHPLDRIFGKAVEMSKNIVMLLPPNINVEKLGQLIALQYINRNIVSSTCSIKIEKIFFMSQLRYLAVYLGSIIENQINLNDQLCYIYNYLKGGQNKSFTHKKVIRYLRQKYGMVSLFNYVHNLDQVQKPGTLIQKLYEFIKQKRLISEDRLDKLITEQNAQQLIFSKRKFPFVESQEEEIMEEQKYVGEEVGEQVEVTTLSYYSENSANKGHRDSKHESAGRRSYISSIYRGQEVVLQQIPRSQTVQGKLEQKQAKNETNPQVNKLNIQNQQMQNREGTKSFATHQKPPKFNSP